MFPAFSTGLILTLKQECSGGISSSEVAATRLREMLLHGPLIHPRAPWRVNIIPNSRFSHPLETAHSGHPQVFSSSGRTWTPHFLVSNNQILQKSALVSFFAWNIALSLASQPPFLYWIPTASYLYLFHTTWYVLFEFYFVLDFHLLV